MRTTKRPNIVLATADDMNWDAVGAYRCPVDGTTPNIDRLAADGMTFTHGHVTVAVCQPSRSAMMTGRYPHNSGGEGFFHLRHTGVPILPQLLRNAGYAVGILGKVTHSTPYGTFRWDLSHDMPELGEGRNPGIYRQYARSFVQDAAANDQPFFLMFNSHDPHRPFCGNDPPEWYDRSSAPAVRPSREFTPEEITVPGFLENLPAVRQEIAEYYSSVRRCDDTIGALLSVLDDAGVRDNTIVIFLSDNGMAFPFAKTNCYLHSTRTPLIVRWPAVVKPGMADQRHFVAGIDIMPTLLEAAGLPVPESTDGSSFLPLLRGEHQNGRGFVVTHFHQTSGRRNYPMRCIQDARYGYIFNPWSDGQRVFRNESRAGRTFTAMKEAAQDDARILERVTLFEYRVPEELYDFQIDPDARHNLIADPEYRDETDRLRGLLTASMETHHDPMLDAFRSRDDRAARERAVTEAVRVLGGE